MNTYHKNYKKFFYRTLFILISYLFITVFFALEEFLVYRRTGWTDFTLFFKWSLVRWMPWTFFTLFILYLAKRFPFNRQNIIKFFSIHILNVIFFTIMQAVIYTYFYYSLQNKDVVMTLREIFLKITRFIHNNILIYVIILAGYFILEYYRKFREREIRTYKLEARLSEAKLEVLKIQLHPHFLFNTHHAISALIPEDPEAADDMLSLLSDLLRMTLEKSDLQEVTLREEMEFLKIYMEIQKIRFRDRLEIIIDIEKNAFDAFVPNLILQPIVENSITHGISPKPDGGRIVISAGKKGDSLEICIYDNGVGLKIPENSKLTEGYGILNTKERLKEIYRENHSFIIESDSDKGFRVTLKIPYRT